MIAESIPHIVWLADAEGSTDYFNERGTSYTGYPRQYNYGWKWLNLIHTDDVPRAQLGWEHAARTATPFELSYRIRRSDGEFRWFALRALPVRGPDGAILRWIGTADDLDGDHVRLRDEAQRVERQTVQLRSLLAAIGPPSSSSRASGGDHTVLRQRVNEAFKDQPGVEPVDLAGSAALDSRDLAVLRLVARGYTNAEVANLLGFSLRTIELRRAWLREHLGLQRRADFVRYAYEAGLTTGNGESIELP